MNGVPYSEEQDHWLSDNVAGYHWDLRKLTDGFNVVFAMERSLNSIRKHLRFICAPCSRYTPEQDAWIRDRGYMHRGDLTRLFNRTFGCDRTVKAISERCRLLGAIRNECSTKEAQMGNVWTEDMDAWLVGNARSYRGRYHDLYLDLNHRFGTRFCERAVHTRCERLKVNMGGFRPEEDAWLVANKDTDRRTLTDGFNRLFNENRSVKSIQSHMQRLGAYNLNGTRYRRDT